MKICTFSFSVDDIDDQAEIQQFRFLEITFVMMELTNCQYK